MIFIKISAPFATFKNSYSREYAATYPVPTPATIYGCLLSLVGETNPESHRNVKLQIGLLSLPKKSTVLRTVRRYKHQDINHPTNSRPDYQEILSDLEIIVGVDSSEENQPNPLETRIQTALTSPETIERFGGWSLGESRDLIDDVRILSDVPPSVYWLVKDCQGNFSLPVQVDYLGGQTQRETFTLKWANDSEF